MSRFSYEKQAAVMIIVAARKEREEILFIKRAEYMASHGGEVAFPGGKWEEGDQGLLDTAYRETHEEVGISSASLRLRGEMPSGYTGKGVKVTPYAADLVKDLPLKVCDFEIESAFWAPVGEFLADNRVRTDIFTHDGHEYWSPVYEYGGYTVWGFTARTLVYFLNKFYSAGIYREHSAPEVLYVP